jgi:hypothetical protein
LIFFDISFNESDYWFLGHVSLGQSSYSEIVMMEITNNILRKAQLTGILERICQGLELSQTQFESAKSRYEAVGRWLADSADPRLAAASI